LQGSGFDAEVAHDAFMSYWDEVKAICANVTQKYVAAGGDPNEYTTESMIFEAFGEFEPWRRRRCYYNIIGESGGGKGHLTEPVYILGLSYTDGPV
jgi:hypothetical protein